MRVVDIKLIFLMFTIQIICIYFSMNNNYKNRVFIFIARYDYHIICGITIISINRRPKCNIFFQT